MEVDIRISFLSHLQAEIYVLSVWRPPSWTSDFQFGFTALGLLALSCWTPGRWGLPLDFRSCLIYRQRYKYYWFWAVIFDFRLPAWSHSIATSSNEFLYPQNMGIAVRISFLSHLQAEILQGVVTILLLLVGSRRHEIASVFDGLNCRGSLLPLNFISANMHLPSISDPLEPTWGSIKRLSTPGNHQRYTSKVTRRFISDAWRIFRIFWMEIIFFVKILNSSWRT
jgi:hypothetical protein